MSHQREIMDAQSVYRAMSRIAHEILEKNKGTENLLLMGIQRRGVPLAQRLAKKIMEVEKTEVPLGILDITFYRDDLSLLNEQPKLNGTDIPFSITDKHVVLVDDVLYTGRTVRAAIDSLMDMGRPRSIQLAVLIDRGHRELPIRADYVGKNVPTSSTEIIKVHVEAIDGDDCVLLIGDSE